MSLVALVLKLAVAEPWGGEEGTGEEGRGREKRENISGKGEGREGGRREEQLKSPSPICVHPSTQYRAAFFPIEFTRMKKRWRGRGRRRERRQKEREGITIHPPCGRERVKDKDKRRECGLETQGRLREGGERRCRRQELGGAGGVHRGGTALWLGCRNIPLTSDCVV